MYDRHFQVSLVVRRADDQFAVENPVTGKTIAIIQGAGQCEVDDAVCAAETAFQKWRWSSPGERAAMIRRIARKVGEHLDDVAQLDMEENGKPLFQTKTDVHGAVALFEYYANLIGMQPTQLFDGGLVYGATLLEPHGVVAAIIPFNWPPVHTASKIAAALEVGNTVVVKPPALRAAHDRAHPGVLPDDVVHVFSGQARPAPPRQSSDGPDDHLHLFAFNW